MDELRKEIIGIFKAADDAERRAMNMMLDISVEEQGEKRIAVIRTSDRNTFRGCRRKWNWSSHLRRNLGPKTNAAPLWFGSGFHFAMEDRHGLQRFNSAKDAFDAYVKATLKFNKDNVPGDWKELQAMGHTLFDYYEKWLAVRPQLPTLVVDGVPQVEVNFRIPLPIDPELLAQYGYDEAVYSGTIDRVCWDEEAGLIWLLDYKSVKMFNTAAFMTDSQITTYCWAASCLYDAPVAGMIYAQHKKKEIKLPKILRSGKLSVAQNQGTTAILYLEQIHNLYGARENASEAEQKFLQSLIDREDRRYDDLIRFDFIPRNEQQQRAEGAKILLEAKEMLNPQTPLYPNPTRDCTNFCSFTSACVSLDDGGHFEDELAENFVERPKEYDGWREHIVYPGDEVIPVNENLDWENI